MPWAFKLCLAKVTGPSLLYMTVGLPLQGWDIWQLLTALSSSNRHKLIVKPSQLVVHCIIWIHHRRFEQAADCQDVNKDLTPKDQDKDLTPKDKDLVDLTPQGQGPHPQGPGQGQGLEICP